MPRVVRARCSVMFTKILFEAAVFSMAFCSIGFAAFGQGTTPENRPRAADLGLKVGILPAGPLDAITDVAGVAVGQKTILRGEDVRTGVTAVIPHTGNHCRYSGSHILSPKDRFLP